MLTSVCPLPSMPKVPLGRGKKEEEVERGRRRVRRFQALFLHWEGDSCGRPWEGQFLRPD